MINSWQTIARGSCVRKAWKLPSSRLILIYFKFRSKPSLITVICMDPHSPNKLFATKYCFLILGDEFLFLNHFFIFRLFFFFCYFMSFCYYLFLQKLCYYYHVLINFFSWKLLLFFHVPACSGMFHVPGFIDAPTVTTLNGTNLCHNELRNFHMKFSVRFTTSFQSLRFDWQLRNEIAQFVTNFGNFKGTSETVCQKFCETHCKSVLNFRKAYIFKSLLKVYYRSVFNESSKAFIFQKCDESLHPE